MVKKSIFALALTSLILLGLTYTANNAFAHTFSGDESASFLALVESMRVELQLVQNNLANKTLAEKHVEHALEHLDNDTLKEITEKNARLGRDLPAALEDLHESVGNATAAEVNSKVQNINDLLGETVAVRIERGQLNNSTVWALVLANMADGTLDHYKEAYGIESEEGEHGDESVNATRDESTTASSNTTYDGIAMNDSTSISGEKEIVSMASYQSSQELANRTLQIFNKKVKALAPANATAIVQDIQAGLQHLKQAIDSKEPPEDVEVILHTEVHPNIQKAYNLQVMPEFLLPLLIILPAIAGIIAAGRLNLLRRK